ncbi:MAG: SH3 domain-containing protein [Anaerotruncus sp.]|nr:SH3 domain-containing protein [Anaerotruncus sp.]
MRLLIALKVLADLPARIRRHPELYPCSTRRKREPRPPRDIERLHARRIPGAFRHLHPQRRQPLAAEPGRDLRPPRRAGDRLQPQRLRGAALGRGSRHARLRHLPPPGARRAAQAHGRVPSLVPRSPPAAALTMRHAILSESAVRCRPAPSGACPAAGLALRPADPVADGTGRLCRQAAGITDPERYPAGCRSLSAGRGLPKCRWLAPEVQAASRCRATTPASSPRGDSRRRVSPAADAFWGVAVLRRQAGAMARTCCRLARSAGSSWWRRCGARAIRPWPGRRSPCATPPAGSFRPSARSSSIPAGPGRASLRLLPEFRAVGRNAAAGHPRLLDGAWYFVEAGFVAGWLPARGSRLDGRRLSVKAYQTGRYAALLRDDVTLRGETGDFLMQSHLGAIFPVAAQDEHRSAGSGAGARRRWLSRRPSPRRLAPGARPRSSRCLCSRRGSPNWPTACSDNPTAGADSLKTATVRQPCATCSPPSASGCRATPPTRRRAAAVFHDLSGRSRSRQARPPAAAGGAVLHPGLAQGAHRSLSRRRSGQRRAAAPA